MGGGRGARPVQEGRRTVDTRGSKTTQILTRVADFRGWGVRELAGVPRRFRDGAGVRFGTQSTWMFGPKLDPTGSQNDANDLDCVQQMQPRPRVRQK